MYNEWHHLFEWLPSGRQHRTMKARTNRLESRFHPNATTVLQTKCDFTCIFYKRKMGKNCFWMPVSVFLCCIYFNLCKEGSNYFKIPNSDKVLKWESFLHCCRFKAICINTTITTNNNINNLIIIQIWLKYHVVQCLKLRECIQYPDHDCWWINTRSFSGMYECVRNCLHGLLVRRLLGLPHHWAGMQLSRVSRWRCRWPTTGWASPTLLWRGCSVTLSPCGCGELEVCTLAKHQRRVTAPEERHKSIQFWARIVLYITQSQEFRPSFWKKCNWLDCNLQFNNTDKLIKWKIYPILTIKPKLKSASAKWQFIKWEANEEQAIFSVTEKKYLQTTRGVIFRIIYYFYETHITVCEAYAALWISDNVIYNYNSRKCIWGFELLPGSGCEKHLI